MPSQSDSQASAQPPPLLPRPNISHSASSTSSSSSSASHLSNTSYSEIELRNFVDRILYPTNYQDPVSKSPLYILNSTALPSPRQVSYNLLLPHLLEVVARVDYSILFFAGGATSRPTWAWMIHTYSTLDRDVRKRLKRLYIVHENWWVRTIMKMVASAVSSKFRHKVIHVADLSSLADYLDIRFLNIPLAVYIHDRKLEPAIEFASPYNPLFGRDLPSDSMIPLFWRECIAYLSVEAIYAEGVFRVSPRLEDVDILREAFDRCQLVELHDYTPHVVASVLKLFLRQLPSAPLPLTIIDAFPEFSPSLENSVMVLEMLNRQTVSLFSLLMPLLADIALHERTTRMSILSLSRAITPSLLRISVPGADDLGLPSRTMTTQSIASSSTVTLVTEADPILYISDPMEVVRILDYYIKVFECLVYYWSDLPLIKEAAAAAAVSEDKDSDNDSGRSRSLSRKSSTSTLKSVHQLPPPLPMRKFSVSSTSSNTSKPLETSTLSTDGSSSTTSSSTTSSLSAPSPDMLEILPEGAPPTPEQSPEDLSLASITHTSASTQKYSSFKKTNKKRISSTTVRSVPALSTAGEERSESGDMLLGAPVELRESPLSPPKISRSRSVSPTKYSSPNKIISRLTAPVKPDFSSSTEADTPYIPLPPPSTVLSSSAVAAASRRNVSTSSRPAISVVGGFRAISADADSKHAAALRGISPYVSTPDTPASLLQSSSINAATQSRSRSRSRSASLTNNKASGKENTNMRPPPLPLKPAVRKFDGDGEMSASSTATTRKKGKIVEELTKLYEERSQSVHLLLQMDQEDV
ncbi:uncharacterized protein V1516DRAFT_274674 [Lipomyces oligophaga]|uniref:uncharacterized protein n=1 Tax=Lipomyces oligophaga TaxID=45792 RepID=UPI0034CF4B4E